MCHHELGRPSGHGFTERFGSERTVMLISLQPPAMSRDTLHSPGAPGTVQPHLGYFQRWNIHHTHSHTSKALPEKAGARAEATDDRTPSCLLRPFTALCKCQSCSTATSYPSQSKAARDTAPALPWSFCFPEGSERQNPLCHSLG